MAPKRTRTRRAHSLPAGLVVEGSIVGEGDLDLSCRVEGDVRTRGAVRLRDRARVAGDVEGTVVRVEGDIRGSIRASEQVVLEAGARVMGDVRAPSVRADADAQVRGDIEEKGPRAEGLAKAGRVSQHEPRRTRASRSKREVRPTVGSMPRLGRSVATRRRP